MADSNARSSIQTTTVFSPFAHGPISVLAWIEKSCAAGHGRNECAGPVPLQPGHVDLVASTTTPFTLIVAPAIPPCTSEPENSIVSTPRRTPPASRSPPIAVRSGGVSSSIVNEKLWKYVWTLDLGEQLLPHSSQPVSAWPFCIGSVSAPWSTFGAKHGCVPDTKQRSRRSR